MSAELSALQTLASDFNSGIFRLSPNDLAVLFWTSNYLEARRNWKRYTDPYDTVTDNDWDVIEAMVASALGSIKVPIVGYIIAFVTEDPPGNVLPCDGSEYLRADYPQLYEVIDPFFITDADHFIVPDLRGRTVIGTGASPVLSDYDIGDVGGEEEHQLSESELASHAHSIGETITTLVLEPGEVPALTPVPIIPAYTGSTGGDSPHNNMQPYYALNYGIVAS